MEKHIILKVIRYVISITLFGLLFFDFVGRVRAVPFHPDEISWFFHTRFFEKVFLDRDISDKKFWLSDESFDHPILSKYIFGIYLFLINNHTPVARKILEHEYGRWNFYSTIDQGLIKNTPFVPYINRMREVNIFFTFLTLSVLFVTYYCLFRNVLFALLLPFVLERNNLFLTTAVRATSDIHYIFFCLLGVYLFTVYLQNNNKKYLYIFSLCCGLAVSSKLTGIVLLLSYIVFELLVCISCVDSKVSIKRIAIVLSVSAFVWFIINPTLYIAPVDSSFSYIVFRNYTSLRLQHSYPNLSLIDIWDRIYASLCVVINVSCRGNFPRGYIFPFGYINLVLFVIGAVYLSIHTLYQRYVRTQIKFIFLFCFIVLLYTISYIPLAFDRYFTFPVIIVTMIQIYAIQQLLKTIYSRVCSVHLKPRLKAGVL